MPLIQVVLILVVVGVLLWLVNVFIPMQASIKRIVNVLVIITVVLWLLNLFGLFGPLSTIKVGKPLVGTVSLALTDPPYGGIVKSPWDCITVAQLLDDLARYEWLLKPGGSVLMFGGIGTRLNRVFFEFLVQSERLVPGMFLRDVLTWRKRRAYGTATRYLFIREEVAWFTRGPEPAVFHVPLTQHLRGYAGFSKQHPAKSAYLRVGNVIDDVTELLRGKVHPTEKPLPLIQRFVTTHTNPGDLVLDPYAGSGTVGLACRNTGRQFWLVEKDPTHFATCAARCMPLSCR